MWDNTPHSYIVICYHIEDHIDELKSTIDTECATSRDFMIGFYMSKQPRKFMDSFDRDHEE